VYVIDFPNKVSDCTKPWLLLLSKYRKSGVPELRNWYPLLRLDNLEPTIYGLPCSVDMSAVLDANGECEGTLQWAARDPECMLDAKTSPFFRPVCVAQVIFMQKLPLTIMIDKMDARGVEIPFATEALKDPNMRCKLETLQDGRGFQRVAGHKFLLRYATDLRWGLPVAFFRRYYGNVDTRFNSRSHLKLSFLFVKNAILHEMPLKFTG